MYKLIGCCLLVGALILGWLVDAHLSPEEKINKAFLPSSEVRISLENLQALIPKDDASLKSFESNYRSKLELRALKCMQGNSISRFDSINKIKKLDIDVACFRGQDEELKQLIGITQVSYRLAQPALRPIVKLGAPSIINDSSGVGLTMGQVASKAGVAVLKSSSNDFISVEIPSGKKLASLPTMPDASSASFSLSPNGRILAIPVQNREIRFLDNETGQELWLAKDMNQIYVWLPEIQVAIVKSTIKNDANREDPFSLIDFKTGQIKSYSTVFANSIPWALQVSETPTHVLIGDYTEFSLVEYARTSNEIYGSVIKKFSIKSKGKGIGYLAPTLMLNGKSIAFATGDRNYMLFDLKTGEEKVFETAELFLDRYAKLSEETLLVDSYINISSGERAKKSWVFNVKDSTLSPIVTIEASVGDISALNGRIGFIRKENKKLWIGDEVQVGKPERLETIITGYRLEKQLAELETAERIAKASDNALKAAEDISRIQQKMGINGSSNTNLTELKEKILLDQLRIQQSQVNLGSAFKASEASSVPGAPFSGNNYDAIANEARRQAIFNVTNRMLGNIPVNAKVEAIGVHESKDRSPSGINVIVKKSHQPLVLILSGSEPVRWNLIKEPGANLVAVIATGTRLPQVSGAGVTKTVIMSSNKYYPYEQKDPSYAGLNNDSVMWTGKPISKFQGVYAGTTFVVGD
ncbi:MAG: hypothetical protein H0W85_01170 [Methylotenera sp.]|nr:hypothetical protein [Methylotenera sp.]